MHSPIIINNISLSLSHKLCFNEFSATIYPGSRIAIIGRNGCGKSSLMDILRGKRHPSQGRITLDDGMRMGYVEQTIQDFKHLSGGQKLNKRLSEALANSPDLLLLDEPTNHLDASNRKSLIQMLKRYEGTLIIISHDTNLIRQCTDTLWHIDNQSIQLFTGSYDDYIKDIIHRRKNIENKITSLQQSQKQSHQKLMKEQKRASKSKKTGEKNINNRKWPTIVSQAKSSRSQQTSGKKQSSIKKRKQELSDKLSDLRLNEEITPTFEILPESIQSSNILSIRNADLGYSRNHYLIKNICLSLSGKERLAIHGCNASGKSTLLKAILGDPSVLTTGEWLLPKINHIGYVSQHYLNLDSHASVVEHIQKCRPEWNQTQCRRHLGDFLFRKNEDVQKIATDLSGGEKARLSLSMIAAKTPRLLILDEVSNNLDIETKEHVIDVLKAYPGTIILVSHDEDFLRAINIDTHITITNGQMTRQNH